MEVEQQEKNDNKESGDKTKEMAIEEQNKAASNTGNEEQNNKLGTFEGNQENLVSKTTEGNIYFSNDFYENQS